MTSLLLPRSLIGLAVLIPWTAVHAQSTFEARPESPGLASPLEALPITFVENQGQWEGPARFAVSRGPLTAQFEPAALLLTQADDAEGVFVRLAFEGTMGEAWIEGQEGFAAIGPGVTLVLPANVKHGFRVTGTAQLKTYGVHASPDRLVDRFQRAVGMFGRMR